MSAQQIMTEDRREYFRIDDQIVLDYRRVKKIDLNKIKQQIEASIPGRFTTASSFATASRQIVHALHKVQTDLPEVASCLQTLDKKLNTLAQLFVAEEIRLSEQPTSEVSMSAGGLAFRAQSQFNANDFLEMRLVLLPSLMGMLVVGRVVHCKRINDGNLQLPWQVAMSYEIIRESDRELLIRHIMTKETEQLRLRHQEDNEVSE